MKKKNASALERKILNLYCKLVCQSKSFAVQCRTADETCNPACQGWFRDQETVAPLYYLILQSISRVIQDRDDKVLADLKKSLVMKVVFG